jgi:hypothetical protein
MKFKLIAAILGLTMTLPAAIMAQNPYPDDPAQDQDQYSKPSPNVPMQDNQDEVDQNSTNQRQADQNDDRPADRSYDQRTYQQRTYDQRPSDQGSSQTYNQQSNGSYDRGSSAQTYDQRSYDQRGGDQQGYGQPGYDQRSGSRGPMDPSLNNNNNDNYNPPSYNTPAPDENNGVARVSLMKGDVSTQRGDAGSWNAAVVNAPVLAGDRISTGDKARTELQLDFANTSSVRTFAGEYYATHAFADPDSTR